MTEERIVFTRKASGLIRELGALDVFLVLIAAPAASGMLYFAVTTAAEYPGVNISLTMLLGGLILLPFMVTLAFILASMPRAGGIYIPISRIINPTAGYLFAIIAFFGSAMSTGFLCYIVVGIFGSAFGTFGAQMNLPMWISLGGALSTTEAQLIGGFILCIIMHAINLLSVRTLKNFLRVIIGIPLIMTVLGIIVCLGVWVGPGIPSAFDATWGTGAFQGMIDSAAAKGWKYPGFSFDSTVAALIVAFWAYTGLEYITYSAGEVKSPRRSLINGAILGMIAVMVLYVVLDGVVYLAFGSDFISSYAFLHDQFPEELSKVMGVALRPSVPLYFASITNPWLGLLISLSMALWFANSITPSILACTRLAFAMSFDRALPTSLANVNRRGAPTWATLLAFLGALFGIYITAWEVGPALAILDFTALGLFWLLGLAAVMFPYTKPEIFKRSPVQWRVGNIPIISILGLLTLATGWYIMSITIMEFTNEAAVFLSIFVLIWFIIHVWQTNKNITQGIDVNKIYAELPPE